MDKPFMGEVRAFSFGFAPLNWAPCEGQMLEISEHTALFTLISNAYGGDGVKTFRLPDLRSKAWKSDNQTEIGMAFYICLKGRFPQRA